ncbi:hypothetical protein [Hymenobacter sp. BT190]|uniref:hypothetical protein n=1 Tax=Hymenobacter sp. BT190 TaxID=2763505 RepID=UPI001650FC0F|nr:hypothetical protein [Hymenobacter sp. BT190]MBC6696764.1 hypothetical protein [Hymenobacter sp. BT190]
MAFTNSTPDELLTALAYGLLLGFVIPMAFLGLPALLGVLGRRVFMQQAFAHYSHSRRQLLLRTALIFECSVLLCWLLWEIFAGLVMPHVFQELPLRHFLSTTIAFFGLSLPWLLSSLAAAWWVTQPRLLSQPN